MSFSPWLLCLPTSESSQPISPRPVVVSDCSFMFCLYNLLSPCLILSTLQAGALLLRSEGGCDWAGLLPDRYDPRRGVSWKSPGIMGSCQPRDPGTLWRQLSCRLWVSCGLWKNIQKYIISTSSSLSPILHTPSYPQSGDMSSYPRSLVNWWQKWSIGAW